MLAWKFLATGAIAPFTGIRWPAPEGSRGARWVEGRASPGQGVHACAAEHLPYWFDEELWEVELDGPVTRAARQLIARRGRLVSRVDDWPACQPEFARACLERTRRRVVDALFAEGRRVEAERLAVQTDLDALQSAAATIAANGFAVAGYVSDAVRRRPYPGLRAYIAANAAAAVDGHRGHDQERAIQTAWLRERLTLDAGS